MVHCIMMIDVTRTIDGAVAPHTTTTIATDDLADRIIDDYRVFMAQMKCAMSERLVRLGISMAQLNIMYTLQRNGEMPMSRLADVLNVSLSNASGLVDRTRGPEDRRVVLVRITAAGAQVIEENDARNDDLLRTVLHRLEPDELPL